MALKTAKEYMDSLRQLKENLYVLGEKAENWVDHPIIRPSINAVAMTYKLAHEPESEDLAVTQSMLTGKKVNRFNSLFKSPEDMVKKIKLQREMGQRTACCFQRCVGMDGINAVFSTTYEIDEKHGTDYHQRFRKWLTNVQREDLCINDRRRADRRRPPGRFRCHPQRGRRLEFRELFLRGYMVQLLGQSCGEPRMGRACHARLPAYGSRSRDAPVGRGGTDGADQLPGSDDHLHDDLLRSRFRSLRQRREVGADSNSLRRMGLSAYVFTVVVAALPIRSFRMAVALPLIYEGSTDASSTVKRFGYMADDRR